MNRLILNKQIFKSYGNFYGTWILSYFVFPIHLLAVFSQASCRKSACRTCRRQKIFVGQQRGMEDSHRSFIDLKNTRKKLYQRTYPTHYLERRVIWNCLLTTFSDLFAVWPVVSVIFELYHEFLFWKLCVTRYLLCSHFSVCLNKHRIIIQFRNFVTILWVIFLPLKTFFFYFLLQSSL